jgi:hypothetical protein
MRLNDLRHTFLVYGSVTGLLIVIALQVGLMARDNSATWDEAAGLW